MIKIVFVCIGNSCRSQMAEGFAKFYSKNKIEVESAGTHPANSVNPLAIEVMKEKGIDISNQYPKNLTQLKYKEYDYIVTMGCEVECPFLPAKNKIEWKIPDPINQPIHTYRNVRNRIEKEIINLFKNIEGGLI